MATYRALSEKEISDYINEEIENEDCSETEDCVEQSDHNTDSEQDADNYLTIEFEDITEEWHDLQRDLSGEISEENSQSQSVLDPSRCVPLNRDILEQRPDLDCVPLSILRRGYFVGKNKRTQWNIQEPSHNTRTRSYNIIREPAGPCREAANVTTPVECIQLFFCDEMLSKIVYYTNIYITNEVRPNFERERDCKLTNVTEIQALLGLLFYIGKLKGAHLNTNDLWAQDGTGCDICIATMSQRRFHFLLRCLRFDDITTRNARKETDKLAPIREIFEEFVASLERNYSHGDHVTIDEMLLAFRGRCSFRQYLPNKPARYGIKIFAVCDARTYYTSKLEIYPGKQQAGPYQLSNSPGDVVKRLLEPLKGSHRNIVMDNWFMSIPLLNELMDQFDLTCLGTLRKNKNEIPEEFTKTKERPVYSTFFGFQPKCTLLSYVPKPRKVVLLASSMHHDANIDTLTGEKTKPEMITDYNAFKCGVDVVDQMTAGYSVSRQTKRWPLCIFFGMLNIGALNAYIIYNSNAAPENALTRRDFLKTLAISMIKPHLHERQCLTNLPVGIKNRIWNIVPKPEVPALPQPAPCGRKIRCGLCSWKKDRKTKVYCCKCNLAICGEHTKPICANCFDITE